jgi:hypothetical protein
LDGTKQPETTEYRTQHTVGKEKEKKRKKNKEKTEGM